MNILLVEDNLDLATLLTQFFEEMGHSVCWLKDGDRLFEKIETLNPDIILLDQILPGRSGQDLLREMRTRESTRDFPIIMVTGLRTDSDQLTGLSLGADDYITKPFSPEVLLLRIEAILRRGLGLKIDRLICDDLSIDFETHRVLHSGEEVDLTLVEFKILSELLRERGKVLTRDKLKRRALGNLSVTDRTVDVHMAAIRKKLVSKGQSIQTVRGVGYRFANSLPN